jgi:hypothetical protein
VASELWFGLANTWDRCLTGVRKVVKAGSHRFSRFGPVLAAVVIFAAAVAAAGIGPPRSSAASARTFAAPWTGTIESDSKRVYVYSDGPGARCADRWHGDFSFVVNPDATIMGTGKTLLTTGPNCSGRFDTSSIVPVREVDFSVSGRKQKGGFALVLSSTASRPPAPALSVAGITSLFGSPLTIPNTGSCTAGGKVVTTARVNSDRLTATNVFALKCAAPCDPGLLAKAQREFDTGASFANAGAKELEEAANEIRDFRDDYVKESAQVGAEKATALKTLETVSDTAFAVAEVTALYVGIGVAIEEIALKFVPLFSDARHLEQQAKKDFARAKTWTDRGNADLQQALAQGPCLGPLEQQLNKALDQKRIDERARTLIDSWEHSQAVYRDPDTGDVLDERAALQRARQILSSGSRRTQAASAKPKKVFASAKQIKAALAQINRAQTDHKRATQRLDAHQKLTDRVARKLRTLLA